MTPEALPLWASARGAATASAMTAAAVQRSRSCVFLRPHMARSLPPLPHGEYPDDAAVTHAGVVAERDAVDARLHRPRVLAPALGRGNLSGGLGYAPSSVPGG